MYNVLLTPPPLFSVVTVAKVEVSCSAATTTPPATPPATGETLVCGCIGREECCVLYTVIIDCSCFSCSTGSAQKRSATVLDDHQLVVKNKRAKIDLPCEY